MGTLFNRVNTGIMALVKSNRVYFRSAIITGGLGAIDELYQGILPSRYFTWYDIFLNGLGGILGLTLVWGISKGGDEIDVSPPGNCLIFPNGNSGL